MGGMSGGGGGGGGGGLATSIVSSVANIGAGWFADKQLAKGTAEAMQRQNEANALYRENYSATQADYAPYQQGGSTAFQALLKSYGLSDGQTAPDYSGFENSPDYLFAMQQGEQALARRQSAQGNRLSPGAQKELLQFNSGLATQNLGNYRNGLAGISDMGMGANNALAQYRMGYGNQLGQGITNLGDLALARRIGRANINYKNVAAQDSIWGGYSGGSTAGGNNRGSTYSGSSSNFGAPIQSTDYSSFNSGAGSDMSQYFSGNYGGG